MKIKNISINNYRAFYGQYNIELDGKNALIYGENGSGKSSLYHGLKDLFEASVKTVSLNENIFIDSTNKDSVSVALNLFDKEDRSSKTNITIDRTNTTTLNSLVADSNKIKAFFDYKKLLKTHFIDKDKVDIFDILINDILYYSYNRSSENNFGEDWEKINTIKASRKGSSDYIKCETLLKNFNLGLKEKLETIKDKANTFINYFDYGIKIDFDFKDIEIFGKQKEIKNNEVILKIDFFDKHIDKHHTFFNEARLTALGISLYLSSILSNPLSIDFKIMFLDDVLIGLDMSNRIPFINILKDYFNDFQLFITTYDKAWFELLKSYLDGNKWKYLEIYSKKLNNNFEIPIIYNNTLLENAKQHFDNNDFKASAVYVRSAFEKILKDYCHDKSLKVKYCKQPYKVDSNNFWESICQSTTLSQTIKKEIELYRSIVMNPISHHTIEKPEFKSEIAKSMEIVEKLNVELENTKYINPLKKLEDEKRILEDEKKLLQYNIKNSILSINTDTNLLLNILDKIIEIQSTEELNKFLKNSLLKIIHNFTHDEFNQIITKIISPYRLNYFNDESGEILKNIYKIKEWDIKYKRIWCELISKISVDYKIQEWFANRNCINLDVNYEKCCSFLYESTIPIVNRENEEIPF